MISIASRKKADLLDLSGCRSQYVANSIQQPVSRILDVGSGYGWTADSLSKKADEVWGVDMDQQALAEAAKNYPNIKFIHQTGAELPFPDEMFDAVILSDVIEHVGDENKQHVIDEIWRVLKPGGQFVFTAPHTGLFAWADPLDFKRRFTPIYRIYMKLTNYKPQTAIEIGHKHVSLEEVNHLLNDRFVIHNLRFSGTFMPFLFWLLLIVEKTRIFPQSLVDLLNRLSAWEGGVACPKFLAYNIRLSGIKQ
jgi:ubiquinone/menaquinone biosynthesis C-methylase UbiE